MKTLTLEDMSLIDLMATELSIHTKGHNVGNDLCGSEETEAWAKCVELGRTNKMYS